MGRKHLQIKLFNMDRISEEGEVSVIRNGVGEMRSQIIKIFWEIINILNFSLNERKSSHLSIVCLRITLDLHLIISSLAVEQKMNRRLDKLEEKNTKDDHDNLEKIWWSP